ncbi:MAG: hypothetical protein ACE5J4_03335 [Candidatus Aenigmatarchaeota archaeon]
MKGDISLLGELIAFLFLVIMGYILSGTIIMIDQMYGFVEILPGGELSYSLTVKSVGLPITHEDALISFLESTYTSNSGKIIPIKRLITAALVQDNNEVVIDGEIIDVGSAVRTTLGSWEGEHSYLLRIKTPEKNIELVWDDPDLESFKGTEKILRIQKISTKIISPFNEGELELYVS